MTAKAVPCYFIQTGWGNIVMRLNSEENGTGTTLTLHQIYSLNLNPKTIPDFNPDQFKAFYSLRGVGKDVYTRLTDHAMPEDQLLEHLP